MKRADDDSTGIAREVAEVEAGLAAGRRYPLPYLRRLARRVEGALRRLDEQEEVARGES